MTASVETKTARPCCPNCGTEQGIYARSDARWNAELQQWDIGDLEDELDCTNCDHTWSLYTSTFPKA